MKVAVCVSGLTYPDSPKLMKELENRFPHYSFFYGVWKGREDDISRKFKAFSFDEPEATYHPYLDIDRKTWPPNIDHIVGLLEEKRSRNPPELEWINKSKHQTKQILMHSHMLDSIPEEYDMIIRARWDLWLYDKTIPYEDYVKESYYLNKPIGWARKMSRNNGSHWSAKGTHRNHWWEGFICDLMIMHPRKLFKKDKVWKLHEEQKLLAAEFGWYQSLCDDRSEKHDCYFANLNMTSRDRYQRWA
jgi:hypothetical protein